MAFNLGPTGANLTGRGHGTVRCRHSVPSEIDAELQRSTILFANNGSCLRRSADGHRCDGALTSIRQARREQNGSNRGVVTSVREQANDARATVARFLKNE